MNIDSIAAGLLAGLDKPQLERLRQIRLLALDVDGVLSDGKLYYGNNGEELKCFSILDGLGIKLLQDSGITVAIITGRSSNIVARRAQELGIKHLIQGREDKAIALAELLDITGVGLQQTAYMGDDLPDLSAIILSGFGATVVNGHAVVKQYADWVSSCRGGEGAVRELADVLLAANGKLTQSIEAFVPGS